MASTLSLLDAVWVPLPTLESCTREPKVKDITHADSDSRINDYNPLLLLLWKDIQFVAESSLALAHYSHANSHTLCVFIVVQHACELKSHACIKQLCTGVLASVPRPPPLSFLPGTIKMHSIMRGLGTEASSMPSFQWQGKL